MFSLRTSSANELSCLPAARAAFTGSRCSISCNSGRNRLLDDVLDDVVRRVIRAGGFAFGLVGLEHELAAVADEVVFEQSFVNRAELLDAQVGVVHGLDGKRRLFAVREAD